MTNYKTIARVFDAEQSALLTKRGVKIEPAPVVELGHAREGRIDRALLDVAADGLPDDRNRHEQRRVLIAMMIDELLAGQRGLRVKRMVNLNMPSSKWNFTGLLVRR